MDCGLYHLAGLLYGDFPNELIPALSKKGKVSADIQGFLRHNENGLMNFHDWKDKDNGRRREKYQICSGCRSGSGWTQA